VRTNGPFASNNGVFRLRQHGIPFIFFIKILHRVQNFYEKEWNLPPCRRRIGPVVPADAWFGTDCVSPVNDILPATTVLFPGTGLQRKRTTQPCKPAISSPITNRVCSACWISWVRAIREWVLKPEHPDNATSLNNLAALLKTQGDYTGARALYERASAIFKAVLNIAPPHTQVVRCNLELLRAEIGDNSLQITDDGRRTMDDDGFMV
jgi:hypothetical protein